MISNNGKPNAYKYPETCGLALMRYFVNDPNTSRKMNRLANGRIVMNTCFGYLTNSRSLRQKLAFVWLPKDE